MTGTCPFAPCLIATIYVHFACMRCHAQLCSQLLVGGRSVHALATGARLTSRVHSSHQSRLCFSLFVLLPDVADDRIKQLAAEAQKSSQALAKSRAQAASMQSTVKKCEKDLEDAVAKLAAAGFGCVLLLCLRLSRCYVYFFTRCCCVCRSKGKGDGRPHARRGGQGSAV